MLPSPLVPLAPVPLAPVPPPAAPPYVPPAPLAPPAPPYVPVQPPCGPGLIPNNANPVVIISGGPMIMPPGGDDDSDGDDDLKAINEIDDDDIDGLGKLGPGGGPLSHDLTLAHFHLCGLAGSIRSSFQGPLANMPRRARGRPGTPAGMNHYGC